MLKIKNRMISNYFMLVALSSPAKLSKCVFRAKFEVVLQKQFLSVVANDSKSDFSP